jgi:hypothetical protein
MGIREMKIHGNIRIDPEELRQQRGDPASTKGQWCGELYQTTRPARSLTCEILGLLGVSVDFRRSLGKRMAVVRECKSSGGTVKKPPPSRSSRRVTARETVATETPIVAAAAANEPSSATFANIANPSKSGNFDIGNFATMAFNHFHFEK